MVAFVDGRLLAWAKDVVVERRLLQKNKYMDYN